MQPWTNPLSASLSHPSDPSYTSHPSHPSTTHTPHTQAPLIPLINICVCTGWTLLIAQDLMRSNKRTCVSVSFMKGMGRQSVLLVVQWPWQVTGQQVRFCFLTDCVVASRISWNWPHMLYSQGMWDLLCLVMPLNWSTWLRWTIWLLMAKERWGPTRFLCTVYFFLTHVHLVFQVCVNGPNVFQGYLHDPEKTAEAIDGHGWLHTGDIGKWLPVCNTNPVGCTCEGLVKSRICTNM